MTDDERMSLYEIIERRQRIKILRRFLFWFTILFLVAIIGMLSEARCEEKPDKLYRISQAVLIGGTVADWVSSAPSEHTREANPSMSSNRYAQAAVMTATSGFVMYLTHRAHVQGHRKTAIWGNMVMGGIHLGAAGWNISLEMRLR
jgi:preprotein translocase subunit SecG